MAIVRGAVYFVELNPVKEREQGGRRPVVVVSNDRLNGKPLVVTVVPGTRLARSPMPYFSNVTVPADEAGLTEDTVFLTFQMRALDHSRFEDPPCGSFTPERMEELEEAMRWTLIL